MSMRFGAILVGLLLSVGLLRGQESTPGTIREDVSRVYGSGLHYSLSKQFVVCNPPHTGWLPALDGPELVRLEPNLLAVSCERIKHEFLHELGETADTWRGVIRIDLHPAQKRNEIIQINAARFDDGWSYRLAMPDAVESTRLVEAVVDALLLEMANRNTKGRCAEVPLWLRCGMAQQIRRDATAELVLRPPSRRDGSSLDGLTSRTDRSWGMVNAGSEQASKVAQELGVRLFGSVADAASSGDPMSLVMANPLASAHEQLRAQSPLTLAELSWPEDNALEGVEGAQFRNSAQLLVCDLERLPNGRPCVKEFVNQLPQYYNWQMALLKGFHDQFDGIRDFEKWWALQVEAFTQRDLTHTWSDDESWRKLEAIIRPAVLVRTATNEPPMHTDATLQSIIRGVEIVRQTALLKEKIEQFNLLRSRVSPRLVQLVDGYRQALADYFNQCQRLPVARLARSMADPKLERIVAETVWVLNGLDARLEELRPKGQSTVTRPNDTASVDAKH